MRNKNDKIPCRRRARRSGRGVRAYFDEGLRSTGNFRAAFDHVVTTLPAREAREGLTPSDPQISVGADIAAYLDAAYPAPAVIGG